MNFLKTYPDLITPWQIYIIQCGDGTLYTGITKNIKNRISLHNAGKGSKYTRGRRPVNLVYLEWAANQGSALRREYEIKQLDSGEKQKLITGWSVQNADR
ncbi:MAG: GIY-YIG nuclease family protein [Nitrospiria bacterium]